MRTGLLLRCVRKELSVPTVSHAAVLTKVFHPKVQPSELASLATATGEVVPHLDLPQTVMVLELFSRRGIRHEALFLRCLWKVFKASLPTPTCGGDTELMQGFATHTVAAFHAMCKQGLVHDPQLLTVALGRCVECAPYMTLDSVVQVYEAIKDWDRKFFSIAEVALHSGGASPQNPLEETVGDSPTVFSSQPNLVDVLCGELECRLISLAQETFLITDQQAVRLLASLAAVGVSSGSVISALFQLMEPVSGSMESLLNMLVSLHAIHVRVVDVLDYDGGCSDVLSGRTELVGLLTAKLLALGAQNDLSHRSNWQLVLRFRKLFEKYPELAEGAPQLWDAVRAARVPHREVVSGNGLYRRPDCELFKERYAVKVKPITVSAAEVERFVPPQFKTWSGPVVTNNRHKGPKTPRVVGFGIHKIPRDYIKVKRRKFAPSVW